MIQNALGTQLRTFIRGGKLEGFSLATQNKKTTGRSCSTSLEKQHKRRMQHFGDVTGLVQLLQAMIMQP